MRTNCIVSLEFRSDLSPSRISCWRRLDTSGEVNMQVMTFHSHSPMAGFVCIHSKGIPDVTCGQCCLISYCQIRPSPSYDCTVFVSSLQAASPTATKVIFRMLSRQRVYIIISTYYNIHPLEQTSCSAVHPSPDCTEHAPERSFACSPSCRKSAESLGTVLPADTATVGLWCKFLRKSEHQRGITGPACSHLPPSLP